MEWLVLIGLGGLFVFIRFTMVNEGTAKALTLFGGFSKLLFRWEKHWMSTNWNIWKEGEEVSGEETEIKIWSQRLIGGLHIYFWPFQKVHRYKHRWTDIRLRDSEMEVEFHEEESFNHVLLKPVVYAFKLAAVETKPPERIPVDLLVLVTLKIRNPYLFLFVAPPTPIEDILARISAETRALVTGCKIDELLELRGESFWDRLKGAKVIEDTLEKWGVNLAEKGIEIREIGLPPEYQKAAAARKTEEMIAAARAEQIRGTLISAVARSDGRNEKEVQEEFRADPEAFYQRHQRTIDDVMTRLSMEERAYLKIETPGAGDLLGAILAIAGAVKRMPPGGGEPPRAAESGETKRTPRSFGELIKETQEQRARIEKEKKKGS